MDADSAQPYVLMLCGSFCFACMGALAHAAGSECDWRIVALVRALMPLVLMGSAAWAAGVQIVLLRPRALWMRSISGSISLIGTFFALTRLPISDVFTLTNMFPVWVALLSWPLLGQKPSATIWLSVVCGLAGVVLIQQPHLAAGNFATFVAVAISLFTALAMIGLHRLRDVHILAVVVHFSMVSTLFAVAAFFLFASTRAVTPLAENHLWLRLGAMGLCATAGQLFLTKAFTTGDPSKVSVVGLTQIVFALVLDLAWLGHDVSAAKFVGMGLILGPTAWLLLSRQSGPPASAAPAPDSGNLPEQGE